MRRSTLTFIFSFFICQYLWCTSFENDERVVNDYFTALKLLDFENALFLVNSMDSESQKVYKRFTEIIRDNGQGISITPISKKTPKSEHLMSIHLMHKGYYSLWYDNDRVTAFTNFIDAYRRATISKDNSLITYSLITILKCYKEGLLHKDDDFGLYLRKLEKEIKNPLDYYWFYLLKYQLTNQTRIYGSALSEKQLSFYQNLLLQQDSVIDLIPNKSKLLGQHFFLKGSSLQFFNKKPLEAIAYYKKGIEVSSNDQYFRKTNYLLKTYLSRAYAEIGKFDTALRTLEEAKPLIAPKDNLQSTIACHVYASEIYLKMDKYDSAYHHINKARTLGFKLNFQKENAEISKMRVKLNTAEKEKDNLILTAQKKKNQNIAMGLGAILLLGSIIAILIYRNTKRKQRIAEQEKELQIQKTTTVLKEQEINTINAMVEGQEKERLRIARDLHDNLGGTLAAVKMHIGNLQLNLETSKNPKELLDKANELISEAYTNVRTIAHERNSGVIAKQGLLPAIQKLASTISSSGGLHIEVHDFGLEERLSNHLEITIFRIIQELVTNVIKHANASELQISLTQHEKELNIVVEDNGNGFVVGKLQEKDGMGLGSIERRVEHLEGTMLVDSTLEKGTNIIIDIPL